MDIEQINSYVGSKIKEYRKLFELSQEDLGKKIGVGKTTISNYEVGIRSPKKAQMIKLAEIFNVSIDDFFPNVSNKEKDTSSTLSKIMKVSETLNDERQGNVLFFAKNQKKEQDKEEAEKIKPIIDYRLTDEYLDEQINKSVAYGGKPLSDNDKEFFKRLLRKTMEERIQRGE